MLRLAESDTLRPDVIPAGQMFAGASKSQSSETTMRPTELTEDPPPQAGSAAHCAQLVAECAALNAELDGYRRGWPPGHFYSPIPSLDEVAAREARLFGAPPAALPAIDLNLAGQRRRLGRIADVYTDQPFEDAPRAGFRYGFDNPNYSYGEAIVLYAMLRDLRPKRLIEVGSGHSSCAILDINQHVLDGAMTCVFVEPYPDLLTSLIRPDDAECVRILASAVQDMDTSEFEALEANDVLFIDSSHVSKVGSDVNHLIFEIFPRLKPGVVIHIHDIFYPFEYPSAWIYEGRYWNECYMLRSFLQYNSNFRIEFFNDYWAKCHFDEFVRDMPLIAQSPGTSLWMTKVA